jgi:hypothetical protein
MKQNFDNLSLDQSRQFIKYFHAAMRDPEHGFLQSNGSGHFENGFYISEQFVNFKYKGKQINVDWRIEFKPDGSLKSIENLNSDKGEFDLTISQFLNDVLQSVLNPQKKKFFIRTYYSTISGCNLQGEYWLPGFRFAPLFPDDDSSLINAERIVVIDQNVLAIDVDHAREVGAENALKYSAYMSFILDLGLDNPKHKVAYFLKRNDKDLKMERESTQLIDQQRPNKMPKKGRICSLGEFKNTVFNWIRYHNETLVCPMETRKIIKGVESSDEETKDAFLRSCLLYQLACNLGQYRPTVRIAYECAAVEAIVKTNVGKFKSFTDFMIKFAGDERQIYEIIYNKIRSAHWHSGEFSLGELDFSTDNITNPNKHIIFNITQISHKLMRKAILNWLNKKISFKKNNKNKEMGINPNINRIINTSKSLKLRVNKGGRYRIMKEGMYGSLWLIVQKHSYYLKLTGDVLRNLKPFVVSKSGINKHEDQGQPVWYLQIDGTMEDIVTEFDKL